MPDAVWCRGTLWRLGIAALRAVSQPVVGFPRLTGGWLRWRRNFRAGALLYM